MSQNFVIETIQISDIDLENTEFDSWRPLNSDALTRYRDLDPSESETRDPIRVLRRDSEYIPLSGRHRLTAWRDAERTSVKAHIYSDLNAAEAIRIAATANVTHGVPTTARERKQAFMAYLTAMTEQGKQPNMNEDARAFGISVASAYNYKKELGASESEEQSRTPDPIDTLLRMVKGAPEQAGKVTPEAWKRLSKMERTSKMAQLEVVRDELNSALAMVKPAAAMPVDIIDEADAS